MEIDKIENLLKEIASGTGFTFTIENTVDKKLVLYMQGYNPEYEDWCITFTIKNPATNEELIENLYREVNNCYKAFDIEENVYLMLEAKRNGFRGVPNIIDLAHNEEYKEDALRKFVEKIENIYENNI